MRDLPESIVIDRNAVYLGARVICRVLNISRNTLKKYMANGMKVRRDESTGKLVATSEDLLEYFQGLPVAVKETKPPCG
ncbi:MAG: hypothetical protein WAR22_06725 [Desulfomonilia bacterium]|jgi:hypothetical protein